MVLPRAAVGVPDGPGRWLPEGGGAMPVLAGVRGWCPDVWGCSLPVYGSHLLWGLALMGSSGQGGRVGAGWLAPCMSSSMTWARTRVGRYERREGKWA